MRDELLRMEWYQHELREIATDIIYLVVVTTTCRAYHVLTLKCVMLYATSKDHGTRDEILLPHSS